MAKAEITIGDKRYLVACEEGQEAHLNELGARLDQRLADMGEAMGDIGLERLLIAVAISLLDELDASESPLGVAQLDHRIAEIENRAVHALADAAARIERISNRIVGVS